MPDSPSAWLRSLAAEATPGPWRINADRRPAHANFVRVVDATSRLVVMPRRRESRLIALAPVLAVLCADAIDALETWKTAREAWLNDPEDDPFGETALTFKAAEEELPSLLARFAALQPDNTKEEQT